MANPIAYEPSFEIPEELEENTTAELVETLHSISEITSRDYGHAVRSVHAKSHGIIRGELRVLDGLPATLAQGLFAQPGSYQVVMRLSTSPGDILNDSVSTPRGLGIKVLGVPGERLPDSLTATTQDFLMVNGPAFLKADAKSFLSSLKLLAKTTDKAEGLKIALSAGLRGVERLIEGLGGESPTIKSLGGHPETNILGETFFTQVPHLYGAYMAKLSLAPVSPGLVALKDAPLNSKAPNALREAVLEFFARNAVERDEAEWELRVQLCTDLQAMPIEDASVIWPEGESPYIAVARINAKPQVTWNDAVSPAIEDRLSFSPWNGLAAHRPLGSIMRVRKAAYKMSADFRKSFNGCPLHEPD